MAEEYRQERKKLTPQDITPTASEFEDAPPVVSASKPEGPGPTLQDAPGGSQLPVFGKIPARFQEMIKGGKSISPEEKKATPQMRVTGSGKLEDLINKLGPNSHVYDEIVLPSKGVFYDGDDGPTDGVLHIRSMTGEEEQILATPRWVRKGQAINMIFQRCLRESYRPENFLSIDRTFLLIWLRAISYTHNYEVELKCPDCDRKFAHTINLDLEYDLCPDDFRSPLQDKLPKSGYAFTYRLSRGKDETDIQEHRDKQVRQSDMSADDTLIYRTAQLLVDIEGLTNKRELITLIKRLPIQDVSYMRNVTTEPPFGVNTKIDVLCAACMHEFTIDLPLEANFFFPRHRRKEKDNSHQE
jgi:hypothetical protein